LSKYNRGALNTLFPAQTKSKSRIHVFKVAEEALVEAAQRIKSRLCIERSRRARRKDQAISVWKCGGRRTYTAAPCDSVSAERIAEAVDDGRILRVQLCRAKRLGLRISLSRRAQLG
jgi:hypothetical protein